ncbi:hypothetical protein NAP1_07285 [Erythrobacter sp. NAP1]|uniref:hypothetical protein n=1 Tax=Erythrobacter sp. NAP1 TaxID=237727 RepID=UPI0000686AEC|nr:hypothetical protein [Erythrobacter sp. NAP1]EAQ30563.1 hypothetical protein NAP1_07285 [Erythrobacter sp. NAP1]
MTDLTKTITKGALGTVAAGAMALASATPAAASDRHRDRGISAGDVIAGAVVIGGIAALAGAFDGDRDRRYRDNRYNDRRFRGYNDRVGHRGRGGGQRAIERCVRTAERQARRFGGYRFADVTQIRDVDRTRFGWRIRGRMEVEGLRGRGYGYGNQGFDRGRFTCYVERGVRPEVRFRGIAGLR